MNFSSARKNTLASRAGIRKPNTFGKTSFVTINSRPEPEPEPDNLNYQ